MTSVPGTPLAVRIVAGEATCEDAEELLSTYYEVVPTEGQGSGGFVQLDEWGCISASPAMFASSGQATTCETGTGAKIVAEGDPGTGATSAAPSTATTPAPGVTTATPGADGSYCDQIDTPTLERMFPDGQLDEQLCQSYMQGE